MIIAKNLSMCNSGFMGFAVVLILLAAMAAVAASIVFWSLRNGIAPMPTSPKAKRRLMESLPKTVEGKVYELGSGWGTLAIPLAKKYPRCLVLGFETSSIPYIVSKLWERAMQLPNLEIKRQDFFSIDLSDSGLVVCYLYPGAMRLLQAKFQEELKPGTWVASNTFSIPGWKPHSVIEVGDLYASKIYLYRMD